VIKQLFRVWQEKKEQILQQHLNHKVKQEMLSTFKRYKFTATTLTSQGRMM
jgi:hypothetical protein